MKKFFSKIVLGVAFVASIVGLSLANSKDVSADTRGVSFVLADKLSDNYPVEASRIIVAGGTDSVDGRNESVAYQKARSFVVQTGKTYDVTVTVSWKQWGWFPRRMENSYKVYVPRGARSVIIQ